MTADEQASADGRARRVDLPIEGMTCAACAGRVESRLRRQAGVTSASVNFATKIATVVFDPDAIGRAGLARAVAEAGYEVAAPGAGATGAGDGSPTALESARARRLRVKLFVGAVLTLPVFVMAMSHGTIDAPEGRWSNWVQMLLATPVVFWCGSGFFRSSLAALRHGSATMDSLVALGAGAAWGYSAAATIWPGYFAGGVAHAASGAHHAGAGAPVYFEAAAVIIVLILLGRLLEARATGRATAAIGRLVELQPRMARVVGAGGERDVPVERVGVGDVVIVRPGERVPIDGRVEGGGSAVDESMLTGESVPVHKAADAEVFAGTINTNGSLRIVATRVGASTTLQQIVRLVREAQGSKAPIARLADRVSGVFVPVVLALAALTFGVWWTLAPGDERLSMALATSVSVLIIACPCALGLATPTAIMVGTGRGAERGILIRSGASLEGAHKVTAVVLDKTGTITQGRPEVTDVIAEAGVSEAEVLRVAAGAERHSEHPLGAAIVRAAAARGLMPAEAEGFRAVVGRGVEARVEGRAVLVGSAGLMMERGVAVALGADVRRLEEQGCTAMLTAVDGRVVGLVGVRDPVKPTSREAVERLRGLGLRVIMLTGDNSRTARSIAAQVGIYEVEAEVMPAGKVETVAGLQSEGHVVAMVGDGINDAPALVLADVGMAVGGGTDVAVESADMTLMRGDLRAVAEAIELSRATMRTIRQNLFWAFAYNTASVPLAAGALYPLTGWLLSPMVASAAMALSSVSVVMNSLRLRSALRTDEGRGAGRS
ncbi:MAG: heavy metal translocating P-type ATPase [Planctomycetota bacterium]|nr:heavy metal translocating P-type ATPase [Planctomycetota bacterium]